MDKKKRNKKKNNKQKKTTEDVAASGSDQTGDNAPDLRLPAQSNESQRLHESHSNGISECPTENNGDLAAGSNGSPLQTKEKEDWIKEEARFKAMIKELQLELESRIQKEAELEMKLSKLQEEKDVSHQKEINLEEKISHLKREKDTLLVEKMKLLENVELLEKETALWIQEEDSIREKIAALNDDNTNMRVQVLESEECKKQLSLEKQQLMENLSSLQSQLEDLERISASTHSSNDNRNDASKIDDLNSQIEAAFQLVEKLTTENAELVEKMNELYIELGHLQAKDGGVAISVRDSLTVNPYSNVSHPESESGNGTAISTENANSLDEVMIEEEKLVSDHSNKDYSAVNQKFPESSGSGEIVQIPLHENKIQDLEGQQLTDDQTDGVPLSDSPLIGAPFRLISFMAKYVSGADLVRDNDSTSVQQR